MTGQAPRADANLVRLEQLLDDPALPQAMELDEAQGYLCAALSGPQAIPEAQWLSRILGCDETTAGDAGRQAADCLRHLAASLAGAMARGEAPVLLLYASEDDESGGSDYLSWCRAYLSGVDETPEDWFEALGEEDGKEDSEEIAYLDEQLFPLFLLTGDAEAAACEAGEEWPSDAEANRLRQECEERLPQAVTHIYRFWIARRSVKTIRHEHAKVGRNDPCPCGSGKKFKKCCAAT